MIKFDHIVQNIPVHPCYVSHNSDNMKRLSNKANAKISDCHAGTERKASLAEKEKELYVEQLGSEHRPELG